MRHLEPDYDDNHDRWLTNVSVRKRFGSGDVHQPTAKRIVAENLAPVLDVGCGDGELHRQLSADWPWVGIDRSPAMLDRAPKPSVLAAAQRLPFPDESVGAVAMLWMLYHLPDKAAVRDYLVGRLMPRAEAEAAAERVDTPLDVTKRGVLVFARRL